jgi:Ser/Thr protein kinase RdoA (MazF antagonist)
MQKEIRALLTNEILNECAGKYGYDINDLTDLRGFQNFVYKASRGTRSCILRIAHSSHRTKSLSEAELDWIMYLHHYGVSAAAPIRSQAGKYVDRVEREDDYFVITAFEEASGFKPHYTAYIEDNDLIRKLGRLTGKIHALTKKYRISDGASKRFEWLENNYLTKFDDYVPDSYAYLLEKTRKFYNGLLSLPKDIDSYGLVHGDIHLNNFHVHNDDIVLFDFDECEYNWFAADVAYPLFYATPLPSDGEEKRARAAQTFYDHFMEGYSQENTLDRSWLQRIPLFLRLREILVLSGAFRSLDLNSLHPWSKEMLDTTTRNIENDQPFLDIRFV